MEIFRPDLCNKRYFIQNNKFSGQLEYIFGNEPSTSTEIRPQVHVIRTQDENLQHGQMTQLLKFQLATKKMKEIAESISSKEQPRFEEYMQALEKFHQLSINDVVPGQFKTNI